MEQNVRYLRYEKGDLEEIKQKVTVDTKMIVLCNPNNPTGATLDEDHMRDWLARNFRNYFVPCCNIITSP